MTYDLSPTLSSRYEADHLGMSYLPDEPTTAQADLLVRLAEIEESGRWLESSLYVGLMSRWYRLDAQGNDVQARPSFDMGTELPEIAAQGSQTLRQAVASYNQSYGYTGRPALDSHQLSYADLDELQRTGLYTPPKPLAAVLDEARSLYPQARAALQDVLRAQASGNASEAKYAMARFTETHDRLFQLQMSYSAQQGHDGRRVAHELQAWLEMDATKLAPPLAAAYLTMHILGGPAFRAVLAAGATGLEFGAYAAGCGTVGAVLVSLANRGMNELRHMHAGEVGQLARFSDGLYVDFVGGVTASTSAAMPALAMGHLGVAMQSGAALQASAPAATLTAEQAVGLGSGGYVIGSGTNAVGQGLHMGAQALRGQEVSQFNWRSNLLSSVSGAGGTLMGAQLGLSEMPALAGFAPSGVRSGVSLLSNGAQAWSENTALNLWEGRPVNELSENLHTVISTMVLHNASAQLHADLRAAKQPLPPSEFTLRPPVLPAARLGGAHPVARIRYEGPNLIDDRQGAEKPWVTNSKHTALQPPEPPDSWLMNSYSGDSSGGGKVNRPRFFKAGEHALPEGEIDSLDTLLDRTMKYLTGKEPTLNAEQAESQAMHLLDDLKLRDVKEARRLACDLTADGKEEFFNQFVYELKIIKGLDLQSAWDRDPTEDPHFISNKVARVLHEKPYAPGEERQAFDRVVDGVLKVNAARGSDSVPVLDLLRSELDESIEGKAYLHSHASSISTPPPVNARNDIQMLKGYGQALVRRINALKAEGAGAPTASGSWPRLFDEAKRRTGATPETTSSLMKLLGEPKDDSLLERGVYLRRFEMLYALQHTPSAQALLMDPQWQGQRQAQILGEKKFLASKASNGPPPRPDPTLNDNFIAVRLERHYTNVLVRGMETQKLVNINRMPLPKTDANGVPLHPSAVQHFALKEARDGLGSLRAYREYVLRQGGTEHCPALLARVEADMNRTKHHMYSLLGRMIPNRELLVDQLSESGARAHVVGSASTEPSFVTNRLRSLWQDGMDDPDQLVDHFVNQPSAVENVFRIPGSALRKEYDDAIDGLLFEKKDLRRLKQEPQDEEVRSEIQKAGEDIEMLTGYISALERRMTESNVRFERHYEPGVYLPIGSRPMARGEPDPLNQLFAMVIERTGASDDSARAVMQQHFGKLDVNYARDQAEVLLDIQASARLRTFMNTMEMQYAVRNNPTAFPDGRIPVLASDHPSGDLDFSYRIFLDRMRLEQSRQDASWQLEDPMTRGGFIGVRLAEYQVRVLRHAYDNNLAIDPNEMPIGRTVNGARLSERAALQKERDVAADGLKQMRDYERHVVDNEIQSKGAPDLRRRIDADINRLTHYLRSIEMRLKWEQN